MSPDPGPADRASPPAGRLPRYKDFPPGWGHLKIPTTSRAAARAGLSLYAPCRPRGRWLQRAAWAAVSALGPAALPGRGVPWHPPVEPEAWSALCADWRARLGDWDAMAVYLRLQPDRTGLILLLVREKEPLALVKLRAGSAPELGREQDALDRIRAFGPRSFFAPAVVASGEIHGWRYLVLSPLPPGLHRPPRFAPVNRVAREIAAALADGPRPAETPSHWEPMHGDLTPWNLRQVRDGRLVLFDWEEAGWGPPAADEVLYRATASVLRREPLGGLEAREAAEFWQDRFRKKPVRGARDEKLASSLLAALERIRLSSEPLTAG